MIVFFLVNLFSSLKNATTQELGQRRRVDKDQRQKEGRRATEEKEK